MEYRELPRLYLFIFSVEDVDVQGATGAHQQPVYQAGVLASEQHRAALWCRHNVLIVGEVRHLLTDAEFAHSAELFKT